MSFLTKLYGKFADEKKSEALEYDEYGTPVYEADIVSMVLSELERRRNDRQMFELQWQLNSNFLYGNQRCGLNLESMTIEQYDSLEGQENEIYNQIEPIAKTRKANLNKLKYGMTVNPRTSETDDIAKAKVSTAILKYKQVSSDFEKLKERLLDWAETLGSCYVLSWWDVTKGDKLGEKELADVDEYGNVHSYTVNVMSGDVNYGILSPYEVFPESMYKQDITDQRNIITEQVLSVDDIYDLYGIVVQGNDIDTYSIAPVNGAGGFGYVATVASISSKTVENAEKVITWYERPGRKFPKGRLIIIIGDMLFHYGELPYDEIPIVQCKSDEVSGQFYGRSFIQSEIPLQRAYNGMMNTVHDYAKRLAVSNPIVEEGSIENYNEFLEGIFAPGTPVEIKRGYQFPKFMEVADFPADIYNQLVKIRSDMEYVAGVSQMMVYGHQSGVTSGKAIENLTEIDNTRLSSTGNNIRECVRNIAKQWLRIYKKHMMGYRVFRITGGNDAGDALTWCAEDINSYDIEFDTENELIYSTEAQAQNFFNALNAGLLTGPDGIVPEEVKEKGLELLRINSYASGGGLYELQRQRANRENRLFRQGIPPVIMRYDDHALHINEHTKDLLQFDYLAFKKHSPEICGMFEEHIAEHQAEYEKQVARKMQSGGLLK